MTQQQVVVITGAAKGIGRYVARTFADEGARLVVTDVAPLDTVVKEMKRRGAEVLPIKTDVRDEGQVSHLIDQANARFGRIDVLINNAAIVTHFQWGTPRWPRIRDMDKASGTRVIETNLGGTFLCTKYVLPIMEEQRSGHIINLSNLAGGATQSAPASTAYPRTAIGTSSHDSSPRRSGSSISALSG